MTPRLRPFARPFGLVPALLLALLVGGGAVARAEDPPDLLNNLKLPGDDLPGLPGLPGFGLDNADKLKVSAQIIRPQADGPAILEVKAEVPAHFHIYSLTQQGGPTRTEIKLDPSPVKLAGTFESHRPYEVTTSPVFEGVRIEQYEGMVIWFAPLDIGATPLEAVQVTGELSGLICRDGENGQCMPVKENFTASANPSNTSFIPAATGVYSDRESKLTIRGQIDPGAVVPGGKARLVLTFEPEAKWRLYTWKTTPTDKNDRPTLIVVTSTGGLTFGDPATDSEAVVVETKAHHDGTVTWTLDVSIPAGATPGAHKIAGLLGYQVCSAGACLQSAGLRFTGTILVGAEGTKPALLTFEKASYDQAVEASKSAAAKMPMSLPWLIGAALLGGLILNLMPCVLPVIGIKILSFAEQAGQSRVQVLALNLWYTLGVLIVFWILAGMAVFLNLSWGEHFQAVWFNILMTSVLFAMGLSFLGVWEIPVPGFATSDQASELADREGAMGALFKGMLTTLLATPCSGPLLGPIFFYLASQPPLVTFLVFSCIGLGMASPYILVGIEPSLIRFIPKPGEWMNTFKHVLGFVMLGATVMLLASVSKNYHLATLSFLVGLGMTCWMIGRIPAGSEWPETVQGWAYGSAVSVLVGLLAFSFLGPNPYELAWKAWEPAKAQTLAREGNTVLVDFTADWCQTCKFNLYTAINTKAVQDAVKEKGVVPLVADWTTPSEEIKKALGDLDSKSIPLLAIYPADRPEEVIILRDLVTQADVLAALEKAGPSRKVAPAAGNQTGASPNRVGAMATR